MPGFLKKIDRFLDLCEANIVGFATILMAAIMFVNVVLRNVFHSGLPWGNEVSSYLNILTVCVAIGAGFKFGDHVGVSVFVDYVIPKKLRKGTATITELCVIVFAMLVCYQSASMALLQFKQNQVSPVLQMPIGILYSLLAIGMLTACIRVIMNVVKMFCSEEPTQAANENGEEDSSC